MRGTVWLAGGVAGLAMAVFAGSGAPAANRRISALPCTPDGGDRVAVRAVNEDFSLALADGRTIGLAGIDPVRATPGIPALAQDARARLSGWLVGAAVTLRVLAVTADRWGRLPALVFAAPPGAESGAPPLPVAQALVDAGLARARPMPETHACWPALLAAEAAARGSRLGLWADPYYAVRQAEDVPALADAFGAMAVVEGRIASVGRTRARLYIDLGPVHRSVALRLARRDAFILDQLGLRQDGLVGVSVRVRGFLDDRDGPQIDLVDADQIEIVGRPVPPAGAPPPEGGPEGRPVADGGG